jgi:hypothetical protein
MRNSLPPQDGFEEGISYRIVPCAEPPPLSDTDVDARATEVTIVWGTQSVLAVEHVARGRGFRVGDALDAEGKLATDYLISAEALGSADVAIVLDDGNGPRVLIDGRARALAQEETVHLTHGAFHFIVRDVAAGKSIGVGGAPRVDLQQAHWTLASVGAHAFVVLLFYFLPPTSTAWSAEQLHRDPRYMSYLTVPTEPPAPELLPLEREDVPSSANEGRDGDPGQAGHQKAPKTPRRLAVRGKDASLQPAPDRAAQQLSAASAGIVGALLAAQDANTPTSPFSASEAQGRDPMSALGALIAGTPGESWGLGGLTMRGTGIGGGVLRGTGIGVGTLGTRGGFGEGTEGIGTSGGALRGREARVPRITSRTPEVMGALSKEVIRRVINRRVNEVRHCYTQALQSRPELQGRVAVRFVISPTGVVMAATVVSSDLGHTITEQCIRGVVARMTFPQPQGGLVSVTYPFVLQQIGN